MGSERTDTYWDRIKLLPVLAFGSFFAYLVVFGFRGVGPEEEPTFSTYPLVSLMALGFGLVLVATPFAFCYYVSKDKRELSRDIEGIRTRHWFTVAVFMYFTGGIYGLWYVYRRRSYPRAPSNDASGLKVEFWRLLRFFGRSTTILQSVRAALDHAADEADEGHADRTAPPDDAENGAVEQPDSATARFSNDTADLDTVSKAKPVQVFDGTYQPNDEPIGVRIYALGEECREQTAVDAFQTAVGKWDGICKNPHISDIVATSDGPNHWVAFRRGDACFADRLEHVDRSARVAVVADVAEAIRTASMYNLSHGALSPETVFLHHQEENPLASVADWGARRSVDDTLGESAVTPYTAPEQLEGDSAGTATDIYRLGALGYHAVCGTAPFASATDRELAIREGDVDPPSDRDTALPAPVDDVILRAMEEEPADRFDTAYAFRRQFLDAARTTD